ncbi:MAG: Na+:solute symporter [Pseudomonadota bacterium]
MQPIDGLVVALYIIGTLAIGVYAARRTHTASDMFAAGGRSPWWVSGLSSFMTLKSAGTFVVWGGLAYSLGVVAIAINTAIGVSGLLVGWFLAGKWRRIGVATPAEFVAFRFGQTAVQFYTWSMLAVRICSTGVALYSVSVMFAALVPLPEGMPFRDPVSGTISVSATIVIFGAIILFYTVIGGLWAVLMTDVLQFVVLQLAVLFVLPLLAIMLHGTPVWAPVPQGYFLPVSQQYSLWFLIGWVAVHFFFVGAEWAFAQRYISVPTDRDAKKAAYLFGALYLVSPTIWLATPILYRLIDGNANPEQAYILASKLVLPAGMLGLMMAAMFSATASAVSAQINVFAGVLSDQVYRRLIAPAADDRQMMRAGRLFTFAIGATLTGVALLVPYAGGAQQIVLTITALLLPPLMAPTVWGLLSGRIGLGALLGSAAISFAAGLTAKFAMVAGAPLGATSLGLWVQANPRMADILIGTLLPNLILAACHFSARGVQPGWIETERRAAAYQPSTEGSADHGSGRVVSVSLAGSGLLMLALLPFDDRGRTTLAIFAAAMLLLALLSHRASRRSSITAENRVRP